MEGALGFVEDECVGATDEDGDCAEEGVGLRGGELVLGCGVGCFGGK